MRDRGEERRLILWTIAMSLGGIVLLWTIYLIRGVLLVLYVSTVLAIGFSPAVKWIERWHFVRRQRSSVPRWVAILILYVGFLVAMAAVLGVVLPPLVAQATALWSQLPGYLNALQKELVRLGLHGQRWTWSEIVDRLPSPDLAVTGLVGALQSAFGAIGTFVTILLLPYYLLVEADMLRDGMLHFFADDRRPAVARVAENVAAKVGAWLRGQLLICAVIGALASLSLWILGVPYFYVLGLIAGLGELVPIIGPLMAAIPAVLVGWTVSVHTMIFVIAYFGAQQFFENSVLVPRVMQRQVGVSAVGVIVALLIGSELLGVVGALLAVPSAAVVQVLLQEYLHREEA